MRFLAYAAFAIVFFSSPVAPSAASQNVTGELEYLEDSGGKLDLAGVLSRENSLWKQSPQHNLAFAFSRSVYWFRGKADKFLSRENRFLVFEWKTLDRLDFYALKSGAVVDRQTAGDNIPYHDWSVSGTYYPSFSLPRQGDADFFLVRLQSTSFKSFPVKILTAAGVLESVRFETGVIWLYGALVCVLILLSLLMFFISRDRIYLYYAGYIFSLGMFNNLTFGNGFAVLCPSSPWFQNSTLMSFLALQIACSAQFVRHLMDTKKLLPQADRLIGFFVWLSFLTSPLPLLGLPQIFFSRLYTVLYAVMIPGFYLISFRLLKSAVHIRVFLVGWRLLFFFGMIQILYYLGFVPFSYLAVYGVVFVFPIDVGFFAYSVWQRYDTLRREKREILERLQSLTEKPRYARSTLTGVVVDDVLVKMDGLLRSGRLYLQEKLKLEHMAALLGVTRHQLSEIINSKFGKNFSAFITLYRIGEAKRLLTEEPEMTILAIAFETGFGSKTQFNVLFKRETGLTPVQFRENFRSGL